MTTTLSKRFLVQLIDSQFELLEELRANQSRSKFLSKIFEYWIENNAATLVAKRMKQDRYLLNKLQQVN
ncbi:MAG: hypothetical protein WC606_05350 [Candidatus Absconditabacterales bacterium]|jgi:hypothetical protein